MSYSSPHCYINNIYIRKLSLCDLANICVTARAFTLASWLPFEFIGLSLKSVDFFSNKYSAFVSGCVKIAREYEKKEARLVWQFSGMNE
ncbi:TPA: hypothetical protein ACKQDZ_000387 [Serratia rubidaea]